MKKYKSIATSLALVFSVEFAMAEETNMSLVKNVVQGEMPKNIINLMSSQYGAKNYSQSKKGWLYYYSEKDDTGISYLTYCIKPKSHITKNINGKPLTFVLANSDDYSPKGSYKLTSGLMGLFVIDKDGKIISKTKQIMTGFNSNTGSDYAQFLEIGKQQYGWIITNGVCSQGNCVNNYEIYTPIDSNIKLIAAIGRLFEDDQDTIHTLSFINDGSEHYPIQIYKTNGEKTEKYKKMIFDKKQNKYIEE